MLFYDEDTGIDRGEIYVLKDEGLHVTVARPLILANSLVLCHYVSLVYTSLYECGRIVKG